MIYSLLAPFYDQINRDVDYSAWADFIEAALVRFNGEVKKPELVLDLGCGTGRMTLELGRRGYDMTGVDYSPEMLDVARCEAERQGQSGILWLCQDMRELELYGTVDLAVCCLDGINHLTGSGDLSRCFAHVHNYLVPDGLFVFDVNGKYKFENIYADNSFIMEEEGAVCLWQNYYDKKRRICDFYITLFEECDDGRYTRHDELQRERMYTLRSLRRTLKDAGFELLGEYSDFAFTLADDDCERIYVVARCKKGV